MALLTPLSVIPVSPQAKTGTPNASVRVKGAGAMLRAGFGDLALGVPVLGCAQTGMTPVVMERTA